jgi:CxxC motif-containing protein
MRKVHKFTCIGCPSSCEIKLFENDGQKIEVVGAGCKIGKEYAIKEFTAPERILTSTVRVENGVLPVLPVKSEKPIPKKLIRESVQALAKVKVRAPIKQGSIVYENMLNTGVNVIASRNLEARDLER